MTHRPRLNHVAITMDRALLDDRGRTVRHDPQHRLC